MPHKEDDSNIIDETIDRSCSPGERSTRRLLLKYVGTGGAIAFAGCVGGSDDTDTGGSGDNDTGGSGDNDTGGSGDNDTSSQDNGGEPLDEWFTLGMESPTTEIQWNMYRPQQTPGSRIPELIWGTIVNWHDIKAEWMPDAADEWTIDTDTNVVTVHIRDDFTWWDGTPVRAQDVATQWRLDNYVGQTKGKWSYIESHDDIQVKDEKTLEVQLATTVNPDMFIDIALHELFWVKHELFKEHLEGFEEATTDSETEAEQKKLTQRRIPVDEPFGYGQFKIDPSTIQENEMRAVKHDGHWAADKINDYGYEWKTSGILGGKNLQRQQIMNEKIDATVEVSGPTQSFLDEVTNTTDQEPVFPLVPIYYGRGQLINHQRKPYDDVRVRKALNYLVDHTKTPEVGVHAESIRPTRWTCLSRHVIGNYIPEDLQKQYEDYTDKNEEKASSLLQDAGFSKEDGTWYKPDGEKWTPVIKSTAEKVEISRVVANHLTQSGVETEVITEEASTLYGQTFPERDYSLATVGWGNIFSPHPYGHYYTTYVESRGQDSAASYADMMMPPLKPEVPMPVGDLNGTPETVNIEAKLDELGAASGEEEKTLVQELAWIYNQTIPQIPGHETYMVQMLTRDQWDFPEDDDPDLRLRFPTHWLPRLGKLNAKTQ